MKRTCSLCLLLIAGICGFAMQSYLTTPSAAVFVPKGFQPEQHLPSPMFVRELAPIGKVPTDWKIKPRYSKTDSTTICQFSVGEDVDLYGTGEIFGTLRRNGETEGFWNRDNGAYAHENGKRLYQTHPWVLGVRPDGSAFGILADNTWKSRLTTDSVILFESYGPAFRTVVIEGKDPLDVLSQLTQLIGTMPMPPLWSLGYQQCRFSYYPEARVREIADEFRTRQIPCDVIWMDIHYMDGYRIFTFNPDRFPNPKATNDYLHSKGYKTVYMIDPAPKAEKGYFIDDQLMANGYYVRTADGEPFVGKVWPGECHFPDFTRPEVRTWWSSLYKDFMALGIDGVWNDMNEPAIFDGPDFSMPTDNVHLGGEGLAEGPHLRYHNQYGYNMVKASYAGIRNANPTLRPFVLSRANCLGGQRYAATWTGDNSSRWEHMTGSIPMTLNMGLTGQAMNGPDIGGFLDDCNPDLLGHWTAMGVFFPFVRNHSCEGTIDQEPWVFGTEVEDACRTAINRRYHLLPYIYTLYRECSQNGAPIIRPVFFADLKDKALRSEDQTFLLGEDLMIIPQWATDVKMPADGFGPKLAWLEGKPKHKKAKGDKYQVELRQRIGSVIPMANLYQNTDEYATDSLTLFIALDAYGRAQGRLYEDKGNGFEFETGDFAEYDITASLLGKSLTATLIQTAGKRKCNSRTLRIAYVTDGKIAYSDWQHGDTATFTIPRKKR